MVTPTQMAVKCANKSYTIPVFNSKKLSLSLVNKPVNIFASGPSINNLNFDNQLLLASSIFVNGSLSLLGNYSFKHVTAYIISDERFIEHNGDVLKQYYSGQPFYSTLPVIKAIALSYPELFKKYHGSMCLIYPVDRPLKPHPVKKGLFNQLFSKIKNKKISLTEFKDHPNFIIDMTRSTQPIGVSLDLTNGFVEAGTVTYVATQLAYSLGATEIHLYGVDLINSNQPRFYENQDNVAPCKLDKAVSNRIVPSFELLAEVYNERGIKVINQSPVSKDLFEHL